MCGIAGIVAHRIPDRTDLSGLIRPLRHRGPDSYGYYLCTIGSGRQVKGETCEEHQATGCDWEGEKLSIKPPLDAFLLLFHARLSIIDLSPVANQPMSLSDGSSVTVFNGEIYNYLELKDELRGLGRTFATHSDTEVVLSAYETWGPECVNRFNGMWAFALWDRQRQQLFLSRDRLGVKPLFYTFDPQCGYFAFASEIKALLALPGLDTSPDLAMCQDYLIFDAEENTSHTFFKHIHRLPPAHNLLVSTKDLQIESDCMKSHQYWDLPTNTETAQVNGRKASALTAEYYDLFFDAVKVRLRADVGVGTALSGGLDELFKCLCDQPASKAGFGSERRRETILF